MSGTSQIPGSPAEALRLAAALMRESAGKATPGPWDHMCLGSEGCLVLRKHGTIRERGQGRVARFGQKDWQATTRRRLRRRDEPRSLPRARRLAGRCRQAWDRGRRWDRR